MDKSKLYEDLVELAARVVGLYFIMSDGHYLAELAARLDLHEWADNIRNGKDGDSLFDFLDDIQECMAVPLLEDGYIGAKDILGRATGLVPDIEQNPGNITKTFADAKKFIEDTGDTIAQFCSTWEEEIRKVSPYKADAMNNLLNTWSQYMSQYEGWLIGFKK